MLRFLYSLVLGLLATLLLPYFLWQGLSKRKYVGSLRERLGYGGERWSREGRPVIWLHAVSVGETITARPLCAELKRLHPGARLFVTTTTATGQAVAREQLGGAGLADLIGYFPVDFGFAVRRVLDRIEPELVILMESELWLNFLSECQGRGIPVVVVNGRISDRSFPRARRARFFVRRLYRLVTRFVMQSEVDAARAVALGAEPERVMVGGNLKYDVGVGLRVLDEARQAEIRGLVGWGESSRLIVAGSTHPGEEELVLRAFAGLRGSGVRLLIAPRHPERFGEVAALVEAGGFSMVRRTMAVTGGAAPTVRPEVILLDTIGELAMVCELAAVVFIGGSLTPVGGHNILEPALAGRPIVVGPYTHNFREMTTGFRRADALIQLRAGTPAELAERLRESFERLLGEPERAREMGERARREVEANRGATRRAGEVISGLLGAG